MAAPADRLPLPPHFDEARVGEIWRVPYLELASAAESWARQQAIPPASQDRFRSSTDERLNWWYTDEELSEWLPRIEQLAAEPEEVYLAFNTKAEDQSVVNAARLQRLLRLKTTS